MKKMNRYVDLFKERDSICVSHYPIPVSKHSNEKIVELMELNANQNMKEIALYVHVPFCDSLCSFCPFNKYIKDSTKVQIYIKTLLKEIELYSKTEYGKSIVIKSINFGGGTPSALDLEQIKSIISNIKEAFNVSEDAAIFIEGNPKNFVYEKLESLKHEGLNRISVGVQTFQPEIAKRLGLYHSVEDSLNLISNAKKVGIDNIGIDLMYNTPGQTIEDWKADIEKSIDLNIDHICIISFCVVPNTKIYEKIQKGIVPKINDIYSEIEYYTVAKDLLLKSGYIQYSVIDFSKPAKEDKHAMMYFKNQADLIGIGPAAFGFINGYMYINNGDFDEYVENIKNGKLPISCGEKADKLELAHGMMAKGLRMLSVNRTEFRKKFNTDPEELFPDTIDYLLKNELIEINNQEIKLTDAGILWGNNVCKQFFSDKCKNFGIKARIKFAKGQSL